jgi:hypothetical protein
VTATWSSSASTCRDHHVPRSEVWEPSGVRTGSARCPLAGSEPPVDPGRFTNDLADQPERGIRLHRYEMPFWYVSVISSYPKHRSAFARASALVIGRLCVSPSVNSTVAIPRPPSILHSMAMTFSASPGAEKSMGSMGYPESAMAPSKQAGRSSRYPSSLSIRDPGCQTARERPPAGTRGHRKSNG